MTTQSAKAKKRAPVGAKPSLTLSRSELLRDGSDREFRHYLHDTLAFSARIQEIRNGLGGYIGLSGTQYTIMISIAHLGFDARVGVNAVASHLHLSGAFVTIEINKLVKLGLVSKVTNLEDRRRVLLSITDKGLLRLAHLKKIQVPVNDAIFGCLDSDEFDVLRSVMTRLVASSDRAMGLLEHLASEPPE